MGELPADKGQHWNLITKVAEYFGMTGPVKAPDDPIKKKQPLHYTVQPGDTLRKIAVLCKVSVEQLKKNNHLVKDTILVGQVLGINGPAPASLVATQTKKAAFKASAPAASGEQKPKRLPAAENQTTPARSKEGTGEPLALIKPEDGAVPWMKYAIAEAQRFKGSPEWDIEKDINYHKETKDGIVTMVGDLNAWCAAFVNWCLMKAGYPIENPKELGFVDRVGAKARADGFQHLHKKDEKKPVANPLYVKIDEPVYGSIAIVNNSSGHGHHAGLVYGKTKEGYICLLGGNQDNRISFAPYLEKERTSKKKKKTGHLEFYVPTSYFRAFEKNEKILPEVDFVELNKSIGIVSKKNTHVKVK